MSFYEVRQRIDDREIKAFLDRVEKKDVMRALAKPAYRTSDFLTFLAPAAADCLEEMARKANYISKTQFGRVIQLFTPLYLSNFCNNGCLYCGFNRSNRIPRKQLSIEEVREEAKAISGTGLKHILILTGDAPGIAGVDYLVRCCHVLREYFSSIAIEIYALSTEDYERLVDAGVDGLTIYQETYNPDLYERLHPVGPKRDYRFRLEAPERGCRAGMRMVNVGALLGLDLWRTDVFFTGLHAAHIQDRHPEVEVSVSLPRMRPHAGAYVPADPVSDAEFVQILLALRLFMPRCGITISTRERAELRDHIIPLGVTRMSAGVTTAVGGHTQNDDSPGQFDISDCRSVEEMASAIAALGYQPVYQDWRSII